MINRRHALGLLAAASILPNRSFANFSFQRSEFRDDLAKRFFDLGTVGTFVGYRVDEYLIIASDKNRSGDDKLPASTFKIPNSIIARHGHDLDVRPGCRTSPDRGPPTRL